MKQFSFSHLKQFLRLAEKRIPANVKIVAELRLLWKDIVGEKMASRSQIAKCEYLPTKNQNPSSDFKRRLVVHVKDGETQTALTTYASEYLERIPNRYRIHSFRFYHSKSEFIDLVHKPKPQKPIISVSEQDRSLITQKVNKKPLSQDLNQSMIDYLITWKNIQQKNNNDKK